MDLWRCLGISDYNNSSNYYFILHFQLLLYYFSKENLTLYEKYIIYVNNVINIEVFHIHIYIYIYI